MKKTKLRKGFTIVELVVVIAVVAVLAAVLIPTFVNLTKKANISSDTVLAKNLNTALTLAEAENKTIDGFSDVITILREQGFIVSNLNPTTDDHYFVWEKNSNQMLLVDGNDWSVVYKSKNFKNEADGEIGPSWYFAVSDQAEIEAIEAKGGVCVYAPKNADQLKEALNSLFNSNGEVNATIHIGDLGEEGKITLTDTTVYVLDNEKADITLNLSGYTIDSAEDITIRPYNINAGTLTVTNGTVIAAGSKLANPVDNKEGAGTGSYGTFYIEGEDSTLVLDQMTLQNSRPYGNNIKAQDGATVNVTNTTITSSYGGGIQSHAADIIIENTTIKQTGYHDHNSTCVAVSGMGTLTVKSGTFEAENHGIYVFNSGGTINIKGGTFKKTTENSYKLIRLDETAESEAKLVVTGGYFTVNGILKAFNEITESEWKTIVGTTGTLKITGAQTSTITIEVE